MAGDTFFYGFVETFIAYASPLFFGVVISLLVAPIFSSEPENRMDGLVLSAKRGKQGLIAAKFLAALVTVAAAYLIVTALYALLCLVYWGPGNLSASFVLTTEYISHYLESPFDFAAWQYLLVMLGVSLAGCLGVGAFCLFVSARCRSSLVSTLLCLAVVSVPFLVYLMHGAGLENDLLTRVLRFTYGVVIGCRSLFTGDYTLSVGPLRLPVPALSLSLLALSSLLFLFLAFRSFRKHQSQN